MRAQKEALRTAGAHVVYAVADAAQMTYDDLRDSGAMIRLLHGVVSVDGRTVFVTGLEVVHRNLLPLLDEGMLATALGLVVTYSDEKLVRLEPSTEPPG